MIRSHRHEFKRKLRAEIIARAEGHCEACGAALKPSEGEADHILPVAFGGEPTAANARWICKPCHRSKTNIDLAAVAKSNRQRDKNTGAIRPKATIPHRVERKAEPRHTATRPVDKLAHLPRNSFGASL